MSALYDLKRPRSMVLFIRTDPNERTILSADLQEELLRRFCDSERISVCCVVRRDCPEDDTIALLEQLIDELPPEADSMLAVRCTRYSSNIYELSRICFLYEYYGIAIYSMEFATRLWKNLNVLNNPYVTCLNDGNPLPLPPIKNRKRYK